MSDDSRPMALPPFPPEYRASGVLLHVTSLPSQYGIGDVGPAALAWIDQLHDAGQSWWQALPLGPTGYGNSPYQSMSSFVGNGLLISPDWLIEDGLLRTSDWTAPSFSATAVDYGMVIPSVHASKSADERNGGGCVMTLSPIVFLIDVNNTLLDNDRIQISPEVTR